MGKSSLLNRLCPQAASVTGSVSEKIGRGRHTTRHSEIYSLGNQTFLFDTRDLVLKAAGGGKRGAAKVFLPNFCPMRGSANLGLYSHS